MNSRTGPSLLDVAGALEALPELSLADARHPGDLKRSRKAETGAHSARCRDAMAAFCPGASCQCSRMGAGGSLPSSRSRARMA